MTARKIEKRSGRLLGTVKNGRKGKEQEVTAVMVYPADFGSVLPVIEVQLADSKGIGSKTHYLSPRPEAALEIVKGILQNLPGVYLAADNELMAIFYQIEGDAKRDAEAINRVLDERRGMTVHESGVSSDPLLGGLPPVSSSGEAASVLADPSLYPAPSADRTEREE